MKYRTLILTAAVALALAAPAAAQAPQQPSLGHSIAGGAQWAFPVSDVDLKGSAGVNASWRYFTGPHLGIEGTFGWWQKNEKGQYHSDGFTTPDGAVYGAMNATYEQRLSTYGLGFNVLGRIPIGRAAIVMGGGPGYFIEHGDANANVNGTAYANSDTGNHFGVQGLAEVEVRATGRLSVFGGLRLELRDVRYADSGFAYPIVGLRLGF